MNTRSCGRLVSQNWVYVCSMTGRSIGRGSFGELSLRTKSWLLSLSCGTRQSKASRRATSETWSPDFAPLPDERVLQYRYFVTLITSIRRGNGADALTSVDGGFFPPLSGATVSPPVCCCCG